MSELEGLTEVVGCTRFWWGNGDIGYERGGSSTELTELTDWVWGWARIRMGMGWDRCLGRVNECSQRRRRNVSMFATTISSREPTL